MSFFSKPSEPQKSIFGNSPNAQSAQNTSNTQNSTSQPSSTFGAVKPGTSIFGNPSTVPSTGGGLFGSMGTTTTNVNATTSSSTPGGNIFGGGATSGNTGLNTAPTSTIPAGGSIFGGGSSGTSTNIPGQPSSLVGNTQKPASTPAAGSLFGGVSATGAGPATNTLFGNPGAGSATPAGGSLFGGGAGSNPSISGKPADSSAPKPTHFGTTASAAPVSTTTTTTSVPGSGLFGLPPKPTETATAALSGSTTQPPTGASPSATIGASGTAPGGGLFGGGGLFNKTSATSTPLAPASATGTSAPNLFGTKPEEKKEGTSASATTTPGFSLFEAVKKDTPVTSAAAATLGAKPTATAATAASVAVPPPSMLRGKTLEEIVNRWSADLETHAREFNRFAAEVAVWDRALIENGNNLTALYSHITAAERQQDSIDQSLAHIEQQQKDLSVTLDSYEKMSQELLGGQGGSLRTLDTGPADTERDKNYILATDLHTQLDDLSGSLTQMIDAVNALSVSSKPNGELNDDPMTQIFQILSSHLESLQWIDGSVREVESKIGDIESRVKDSGYNLPGNTSSSKPRSFGLGR